MRFHIGSDINLVSRLPGRVDLLPILGNGIQSSQLPLGRTRIDLSKTGFSRIAYLCNLQVILIDKLAERSSWFFETTT